MSEQFSTGFNQGKNSVRRVVLLTLSMIFVTLPLIAMSNTASAAQITSRSLTLSSAQPSASTTYSFSFVPATSSAIQGMKFQACITAIGSCTAPTGLSFSGAAYGALTGTWTTATAFTYDGTGANDCIASASILCAKRTQVTAESGASVRGLTFTAVTNPSGASCTTINCTFFIRITTYSTNTYTLVSAVDTGTVAASTTQSLQVSAQVAESLTFCVGNTTADTNTAAVPTCGTITGTSINLGTLSSSYTNVSPVSSTYNGDGNNGLAELSTNASLGATVNYDAIQALTGSGHLGGLRVSGAACPSTVSTDQCINSIGTAKGTLTAGTEDFGMAVSAVNCQNASGYTCTTSSGTTNLQRSTNYNCNATNTYTTDVGQVPGTTNCSYAWDESGASQTIATSASSTIPVVGGESLILKFAATANLVTPTGSYTVKADFVATPTY